MTDTPNILDYGGDPTGEHSSAAALAAMIADLNAEGLADTNPTGAAEGDRAVGYFPTGRFVIDSYCGTLVNASICGAPSFPGQGTTIYMPQSSNEPDTTPGLPEGAMRGADDNWMRFANGCRIANFHFEQYQDLDNNEDGSQGPLSIATHTNYVPPDPLPEDPDKVEELRRLGSYALGQSVDGWPLTYPAVIQSDHTIKDNLTRTAAPLTVNGGRLIVEDISFRNVYKFLHVGDDSDWKQAGISGLTVRNISGFCLYEDFVLKQNGGISSIRNVDVGQSFWPEATQQKDNLYMLWARQHRSVITLANKSAGLDLDNFGIRLARYGLVVRGGGGEDLFSEEPPWPKGDAGGKVNNLRLVMGGEQVQTFVLIEADGFMHRCNLWLSGHAVDDASKVADGAVIEILTDRTNAGTVGKAKNRAEGEPVFLTLEDFPGYEFTVDLRLQESSGPLLRSHASDGHSAVTLRGLATRIGQNTNDQAMVVVEDGSTLAVKTSDLKINATRGAATTVFDVQDKHQLRCVTTDFVGTGDTVKGFSVDHSDPEIFEACRWLQSPADADADAAEAAPVQE